MKTPVTLTTLTAALLATAPACAATWDASTSLRRFDTKVAAGLPQTLAEVVATDDTGVSTRAPLRIDEKLDSLVALPDGSHIVTYLGLWNGEAATISRGDGQLLVDTNEQRSSRRRRAAVARFDTAIASGLPAHVPVDDDLIILDAFGGDIVFADGSHGQMYNATWHGEPAVATRSGTHLDITSMTAKGIDITGFTAGSDNVEHEQLPTETTGEDVSTARPAAFASLARMEAQPVEDLRPNRLTFHLMLHDDVDMTSQHIHAGYVAWWLADLQRNVMHGKKVDVLYSQRIPGVTDMRYHYMGSLHDWSDVIGDYAREQHIPRTYKHKFLLVVKGTPEPGRYGRSWQKGSDGIASVSGRYPELAHQLGHLLGAKHSKAEVRFGGWWCETNMLAPSLLVRSNCYVYSRENMRLIDDYVRTGDGFAENNRWSEDR